MRKVKLPGLTTIIDEDVFLRRVEGEYSWKEWIRFKRFLERFVHTTLLQFFFYIVLHIVDYRSRSQSILLMQVLCGDPYEIIHLRGGWE